MKLKSKSDKKVFVALQVWPETKRKLVKTAKHRGETLAKLLDDLSNI